MTVRELKDCFRQFNVKPKTNINDNAIITNDDIIGGNIFQKFINNSSFTRVVSGLNVIDGKICYVHPVLKKIEIETDDVFPACGGQQEIITYAYFEIHSVDVNGNSNVLEGEKKSAIYALITTDNSLFSYEKPYLVNNTSNDGENEIEVNVYAVYYNKAVKYEAIKHIVQPINKKSSWLVESEQTQYIMLTLDKETVSKDGDIVYATVERGFSRLYCIKDSCGNIVAEKNETGLIENITHKCLITCNDRKSVSILKNAIKVNKQDFGAKERRILISTRYLGFSSSAEIYQEEGGKITYNKELTFEDGKDIKFIDLETSMPTEKPILLISKSHKYIDGEYIGFDYDSDLEIVSDKEWVSAKAYCIENGVVLKIKTTEANLDKENDREASIIISNDQKIIELVVSQQALCVIESVYCCDYIGETHLMYSELKDDELFFKPYKLLLYENGEKEMVAIESNVVVSYSCVSSNRNLLNITGLHKSGDYYYLRFLNFAKGSISPIELKVTPIFLIDNAKIFKGEETLITVDGKDIIDYNYELCFDDHNKYKIVKWNEKPSQQVIDYSSIKYTLTNGKLTNEEAQPIKIGCYTKEGEEVYDDCFSVRVLPNKIIVLPIKTNKTVRKKYIITQQDTGDKIILDLFFERNVNTYDIPLKVVVCSEKVNHDVWTGENGYLLIDGKTIIKLAPCWLSPTMKNKKDIAYDGIISLEEGQHKLEAVNVILLNPNKTHVNLYRKMTVNVDKSLKEIMFDIKCS